VLIEAQKPDWAGCGGRKEKKGEQWLLGPSRVAIFPDGLKRSNDRKDSLSVLLERLNTETLSPFYAPFVTRAHRCVRYSLGRYRDLGPLFADAPYAVSVFGSYLESWSPFHIVTDDAEIVEVLLAAISANQQTQAYVDAHREVIATRT